MRCGGRWIVERSDGFVIEVEKPGVSVVFGRDIGLPSAQRMDGNYVSRQQFSVEWKASSLHVRQLGKNPTFYSMEFHTLPGDGTAEKELVCCREEETREGKQMGDGRKGLNVILVPPVSNEKFLASLRGGGKGIEPATLHFPGELNLPRFTVRYVVADEKSSEEKISREMLTVPLGSSKSDEVEEDERANQPWMAGSWRGILDSVLHEQQQQAER
ncbi:hypothetical protein C4B63_20g61 [Trypanosoma cruzi]|uniref:Uncharacterized protein n=1 Tax=Trypanosoma cruzi TaxID=5693 RepID=A0A2V2VI85_TRYCR|nr:hypothetical protein C4B63_20g61 [Trypanosoma cruzi]